MVPKLGFMPTTPQKAAGRMIEPTVCVPSASGTMPAATATAEPLDEPPGVWAATVRVDRAARVPPGEFRAHGLAEDDAAQRTQPLDHGRIAHRPVLLVERGAVAGRHVGGVDDVLHSDRHAAQGHAGERRCQRGRAIREGRQPGLAPIGEPQQAPQVLVCIERVVRDAANDFQQTGIHDAAAPLLRPRARRGGTSRQSAITAASTAR